MHRVYIVHIIKTSETIRGFLLFFLTYFKASGVFLFSICISFLILLYSFRIQLVNLWHMAV